MSPPAPDSSPPISSSRSDFHAAHLLVAGVSGLAVTVLEFAAVRFMAPSFGQSNYIWANVIGIILLSLSLGYWLGGRLADRSTSGRPLYTAYLLAAGYVTAIGFLGGALCTWLIPEGIQSAQILPLAFLGSLAATVLLFGPPTLVLGMTSPFLIRLDDAPGRAGRVAGRIFAIGTVGSLIGCYLAPLWLLQAAGTRATLFLCAAALAALGAGGLFFGRGRTHTGGAVGVVLLVGALACFTWAVVSGVPLRDQPGQLAEVESTYQTVRVVEEETRLIDDREWPLYGEEMTVRARFLRHDEDAETYQSVWLPDHASELLTGGRYYEHMALGAFFDRPTTLEEGLRVLVIGYAGGAVHRTLVDILPPGVVLDLLGIEIDPAVVEAGKRWLGLKEILDEHVRLVTGEDARTVVNALRSDERFDLILVDAYARTAYMPFQLATVEFFRSLSAHLAVGGRIGVNIHAHRGLGSRLLDAVASTMAAGSGPVFAVPNPLYPGSVVLWAGPDAVGPPRLAADHVMPPALRTAAYALERLTIRHPGGGVLLTDDRSIVDRLADEELFGP